MAQPTYRAKTESYIHRRIAGEDVLISVGSNIANFNGYIELNPSAAFLWDGMRTPVTEEQLIASLMAEYDLAHETASADTREFLQNLMDNDMAERQ